MLNYLVYSQMSNENNDYFKGRGAQINHHNRFLKNAYVTDHIEGLDEPLMSDPKTEFFHETAKKIVNKVESPDIGRAWSMNPYQGCEHGCIYCYARPTHEYWGYSAGIDFESKIIIKSNAAELLRKQFDKKSWEVAPIMLSGNTDCYQPAERKLKITRSLLETLLEYRHPVGMITKNSLILRDLDLLKELAAMKLLHVNISITSMDEHVRLSLEPRTATIKQRFKTVEELSKNNIPVNVMVAPVIPGLTQHEIPAIIEESANRGALSAAYTIVRLNGSLGPIFEDWARKNYPDRADKILNQIKDCHGGQLNDSRFGTRMRGEGNIAQNIANLFRVARQKYLKGRSMPPYDITLFRRPDRTGQMNIFG
jgi:DNA repair photolyase